MAHHVCTKGILIPVLPPWETPQAIAELTKKGTNLLSSAKGAEASQISMSKKSLNAIADYCKNYKMWVRKGVASEYMAERERLDQFCAAMPAVEIDFPSCISQDELDMRFQEKVSETLDPSRPVSAPDLVVADLWKMISVEKLRILYPDEAQVTSAQESLAERALLQTLGHINASQVQAVDQATTALQRLLEPIPLEGVVPGCTKGCVQSTDFRLQSVPSPNGRQTCDFVKVLPPWELVGVRNL